MSTRLPLGWSKILEGLPSVEVATAVDSVSDATGRGIAKSIRQAKVNGETRIVRIEAGEKNHLQPKFFLPLESLPSAELS